MIRELEKIIAEPKQVIVTIDSNGVGHKLKVGLQNGGELFYATKFLPTIVRRILAENRQRILNELANELYQGIAGEAETSMSKCRRASELIMTYKPDTEKGCEK